MMLCWQFSVTDGTWLVTFCWVHTFKCVSLTQQRKPSIAVWACVSRSLKVTRVNQLRTYGAMLRSCRRIFNQARVPTVFQNSMVCWCYVVEGHTYLISRTKHPSICKWQFRMHFQYFNFCDGLSHHRATMNWTSIYHQRFALSVLTATPKVDCERFQRATKWIGIIVGNYLAMDPIYMLY